MRKRSKKREDLESEVSEVRDQFRGVRKCEWCGEDKSCDPHEISRGSSRGLTLGEPSCILALCRECHDAIHRMPDDRAVGLAILSWRRPSDYSLSAFWRLTGRRYPSEKDVQLWRKRLHLGRKVMGWES